MTDRAQADPSGGGVFLKLGGALLTDKRRRETIREDTLARVLDEVVEWLERQRGATGPSEAGRGATSGAWVATRESPERAATRGEAAPSTSMSRASAPAAALLLSHGSGSYAHFAAADAGFPGTFTPRAFAEVAAAARRLNVRVVEELLKRGVPAVGVPGSILATLDGGRVLDVRSDIVIALQRAGLVPVVYGDAALDRSETAGIANTELLLAGLAVRVRPVRIVLATDVPGVFPETTASDAHPIEVLTASDARRLSRHIAGAHLDSQPTARGAPNGVRLEAGAAAEPGTIEGDAAAERRTPERAAVKPSTVRSEATGEPSTVRSEATGEPRTVDVSGGMAGKLEAMADLVETLPEVEVLIVGGHVPGAIARALDGRMLAHSGTRITSDPRSEGKPEDSEH